MIRLASPETMFLLAILWGVAMSAVHIAFAIGVFADSARMLDHHGRRTQIVPAAMWAFATLVGGVFVAVVYWVIHHSSLSDRH